MKCVKQSLAFLTAHGLPSLGPTQQFVLLFGSFNPLRPKSLSHRVHTIHTCIHLCIINSMNTITVY